MGKFLTLLIGVAGAVVLLPAFLTGFGEVAMGLPVVGACMATLAAVMLRARPRR